MMSTFNQKSKKKNTNKHCFVNNPLFTSLCESENEWKNIMRNDTLNTAKNSNLLPNPYRLINRNE